MKPNHLGAGWQPDGSLYSKHPTGRRKGPWPYQLLAEGIVAHTGAHAAWEARVGARAWPEPALTAWCPPFQRCPRAKAGSEGCARESPLTAGLAGGLGLENKLRPVLTWVRGHIARAEVHPIEPYLRAPSSHWAETGSSWEQRLALRS